MVSAAYIPERGDVVWVQFSPQAGHEQAGRRAALVVSPRAYNDRVGLALVCPITSRAKGYPFEVMIPQPLKVSGVVLADQVKSVDWRARDAELADRVPATVTLEALQKLGTLLAPAA
ncbi:MAG TPA: endoribonuclease MazF [Longimicrobium sp.]|nr:endoribonuclease MazF [Longimicrobium sp.]